MPFIALGCVVVLALFVVVAGFIFISPPKAPAQPTPNTPNAQVQTVCATGVDTLLPGFTMVPSDGKLGFEKHLTKVKGGHYSGPESNTARVGFEGAGAFSPHTQDQERWYVNSQWGGWDWTPTLYHKVPVLDHSKKGKKARDLVAHSKLIVTSVETGKTVIASAEESGPALWVTKRDGISFGGPPEVYKALGISDPYSGNPNDKKGRVKVQFVAPAEQKSAKLGLCK
jgi:hypothetical protein